MTRTRIYLVRHGQVEGYEEKRYNGQTDVHLTPRRRGPIRAAAPSTGKKVYAAVYSSDLSRCLDSAELIGQPHGLQPVVTSDLRELHIGEWEGSAWTELKSRIRSDWQARLDDLVHYRVPGGESLQDLRRRVRPASPGSLRSRRGGGRGGRSWRGQPGGPS